jgi:hypothetical protein
VVIGAEDPAVAGFRPEALAVSPAAAAVSVGVAHLVGGNDVRTTRSETIRMTIGHKKEKRVTDEKPG